MFRDLVKRLRQWWTPQSDLPTPREPKPSIRPQPTAQPADVKVDRKAPVATPQTSSTFPGAPSIGAERARTDESAIQISSSDGGRALIVRIGLDFGTAFTKAAIRVAGSVLPVRWSDESGSVGYFLPGVLSEMKDGTVRLGSCLGATEEYNGLKGPFLPGATATDLDRARAIAFVALVLRDCRAFLFQENQSLIQGRRLVWVLNVGCPTNIYDAETLTEDYRRMFLIAWELSQPSGAIRLRGVTAALAGPAKSSEDVGLDSIEAIPEFVAQVAVYARSPQRQDGLHLLVDCGAGTLDIATFNVGRQPGTNEDIYPILHSEVAPLGTHFLMHEFSEISKIALWPDTVAVPTNAELRERFGLKDSTIQQTANRFRERVTETVVKVLRFTKQRRSPLAQAWKSGLPIFLSGGGFSCPVYKSSVDKACASIPVAFNYSPFPLPEGLSRNIRDLPNDEFHRLSVAFGLTYDPEIIGKIYRSSETPNLTLQQRRRLNSDELYAK